MNKRICHNHGNVIDTSDLVVWFGDLNFRLFMDPVVMKTLANPQNALDKDLQIGLQQFDQLKRLLQKEFIFPGFKEGAIKFPPTYKYQLGLDIYDIRKQRYPAFTDRILYKTNAEESPQCIAYNSVQKVRISDHRPVYALLSVKLKPGIYMYVLSTFRKN
ncbi:unnamed protein product [Soboliphyme baturini]|uniref:IPPc domain-containing protein n=1 Tax=Soboliphyme baturini TaxID=241478 RepID=A0A183IHR1_9BILA|nr:unnamed protein product [Soboliphyme baturini]